MDEAEPPPPDEYIISGEYFDTIPCNLNLSGFELGRGHEIGVERALQAVLKPLKTSYDIILIDTEPSLGVLTINALTASDGILITVTPQLISAVGMKLLLETVHKIKKHINPNVEVVGAIMTMCDTRTNLYKEVSEILAQTYGQTIRIFNTIIPHFTKVGESLLRQQSVLQYDANSKPAQAYLTAAKELMEIA